MKEKKVLLITSDNTGLGHKSVSSSINEHLSSDYSNIKIKTINGFLLAGTLGKVTENTYMPLVRYAKPFWKIYYEFISKHSKILNTYVAFTIKKQFIKIVDEFKPDLIVSVHPAFVGSILDILSKNNLDTPLIVVICDIFKISGLWIDKRTHSTICPNIHTKNYLLNNEISEESILLSGFPVREQFKSKLLNHNSTQQIQNKITYMQEGILNFLFICSSESTKNIREITKILLANFNCSLTIITGKNKRLNDILDKTLQTKYPDRIEILGYVDDIIHYMTSCDMLITKGGPNTIMEAINCNTPLILINSVPGQEEGNIDFVELNNLGISCIKNKELVPKINNLLADDMFLLSKIKQSQLNFQDLTAVDKISKHISEILFTN